jgi:hypothetical protein
MLVRNDTPYDSRTRFHRNGLHDGVFATFSLASQRAWRSLREIFFIFVRSWSVGGESGVRYEPFCQLTR